MNTERPVHEIKLGAVKVSLWANRFENTVRYNATVCRLYRDGEAWKTSDSFGRDELPLVIKALDMAHTWMLTSGVSVQPSRPEQHPNGPARAIEGGLL